MAKVTNQKKFNGNDSGLNFEAQLWDTVDKMHGHMDFWAVDFNWPEDKSFEYHWQDYTGVEKREAIVALERKIDWQIAHKRGAIKARAEGVQQELLKASEQAKASVRAFVEPPFHIVKNLFGHRKVRDRGLAKNGHQLYTLFGRANVVIGGRAAAA